MKFRIEYFRAYISAVIAVAPSIICAVVIVNPSLIIDMNILACNYVHFCDSSALVRDQLGGVVFNWVYAMYCLRGIMLYIIPICTIMLVLSVFILNKKAVNAKKIGFKGVLVLAIASTLSFYFAVFDRIAFSEDLGSNGPLGRPIVYIVLIAICSVSSVLCSSALLSGLYLELKYIVMYKNGGSNDRLE